MILIPELTRLANRKAGTKSASPLTRGATPRLTHGLKIEPKVTAFRSGALHWFGSFDLRQLGQQTAAIMIAELSHRIC